MAHYMRKLVIAAFAILAFAVSNFAMVSSGMGHGADSSGHHLTAGACEAAHDFGAAGHVDDHSCAPAPKGMCGDGPTCCSNACQALILTSDFASFRQKVELVVPLPMSGSFSSNMTLLDRPPRA
jgi:hypothetical protein